MSQSATYDVVLLVEQPLSVEDAAQVRSLHQDVEEPVRYHVLLPVDDAAARVESAMGSIAASLLFKLSGKDNWALFVGQWPPTFLLFVISPYDRLNYIFLMFGEVLAVFTVIGLFEWRCFK